MKSAAESEKDKQDKPEAVAVDLSAITGEKPPEKPKRRKPRKTNTPKFPVSEMQIESLIGAVSGIIGSRKGFEIWILTPDEITSIAKPLSNIIEKSEIASKMTEHSDAIALAVACGAAFIPRAMVQLENTKQKRVDKKHGIKRFNAERQPQSASGKSGESIRSAEQPASKNAAPRADVSTSIPDTMLGSAEFGY